MTIGLKQVLDYEDYARIPPDGKRYELVGGDLHVTPAPSPLHQWVSKGPGLMPRLPRLSGREAAAVLERAGFGVRRRRGSHIILTKPATRRRCPSPIMRNSRSVPCAR